MNEIRVPYPFILDTAPDFEGGTMMDVPTWRPGTRGVVKLPDDVGSVADGMGFIVLIEISRHKPGRYPERVFYVRQWIDPDGRRFGKPGLRMTTAHAFARLCKGYRHEFEMAAPAADGAHAC